MSVESFVITHREADQRTCVIALHGDLDLASAPLLRRTLVELHGKGYRRYVLDLSQLTHMDSMGLGVLVGFHKRLDGDARLALAALPAKQRKLLELTGLDARFDSFATLEDALSTALRRGAAVRHERRDGTRAGIDRDAVRDLTPGRVAPLAADPSPPRRSRTGAVRARGRRDAVARRRSGGRRRARAERGSSRPRSDRVRQRARRSASLATAAPRPSAPRTSSSP